MLNTNLTTYDFINSLIPVSLEQEDEIQIINKLNWMLTKVADNSQLYDQLNYEYLCYLLIHYPEHETIQTLLKQIFTKVGNNYLYNLKVQKRRELQNEILSDRRVTDLFKNKQKHRNMRYAYWDQIFDKNLGKEPK